MMIGDRARARFVGMHAVALHQGRVAHHVQEQERDERHTVARGELFVRAVKRDRIGPAANGQRVHADEDDADAAPLRFFDDPAQIGRELFDTDAAQAVVGTERDDEHLDVAVQRVTTRRSAPAVVSPDTPALTTS